MQAFSGCLELVVKITGETCESNCEHPGEETQRVFFLPGGEFDQLRVAPGAVKPYCLYAPVVWLVSSYGLGSNFSARCRVNRAKKILKHGLQHVAMVIPIPKPQDPLRCAWFIPHKRNSKEGRPWEACCHHCLTLLEARHHVCDLCAGCVCF